MQRPDQIRIVLIKTMLNIIHNLNVTVKSNENKNFKMSQLINFKLLNFLTVFKFVRQLIDHFCLTLVEIHL